MYTPGLQENLQGYTVIRETDGLADRQAATLGNMQRADEDEQDPVHEEDDEDYSDDGSDTATEHSGDDPDDGDAGGAGAVGGQDEDEYDDQLWDLHEQLDRDARLGRQNEDQGEVNGAVRRRPQGQTRQVAADIPLGERMARIHGARQGAAGRGRGNLEPRPSGTHP